MLTHYFGDRRLANIFTNLNMGGRISGKVAFLSTLDLLGKEERGFITKLTLLRNTVVHNASNVTFSLHDHLAKLTSKELTEFSKVINLRLESTELIKGGVVTRKLTGNNLVLHEPKRVIWASLTHCLSKICFQSSEIILSLKNLKI